MTTIRIDYNNLEDLFDSKAALILRNFHNLLNSPKNFHNKPDQKWVKINAKTFTENKNMSIATFYRYVSFLKNKGILIIDKCSKNKGDNTNFYQINYIKLQEYGVKVTGIKDITVPQTNNFRVANNNPLASNVTEVIDPDNTPISKNAISVPETTESAESQTCEVTSISSNPHDSLLNDIAIEFRVKKQALEKYASSYSQENIMSIITYVREKTINMTEKSGYLIKALQNNWSAPISPKDKQTWEFDKQLQYIKQESAKALHNVCNTPRNIEEETKIFLHLNIDNENIIMGGSDRNVYCLVTSDWKTYVRTDTSTYKYQIRKDLPHIEEVVTLLLEPGLIEGIEPISKYMKEEREKKLDFAKAMADKYLISLDKIINSSGYNNYTFKEVREIEEYVNLRAKENNIEDKEKYILKAIEYQYDSGEKEEKTELMLEENRKYFSRIRG